MKVFTVESGVVSEGAAVSEINIENANFSFLAITIGEHGRGRKQATLAVEKGACLEVDGAGKVLKAEVGKTKSGKPKLFPERIEDGSRCIVVFRTKIGYRGGNSHTGDRKGTEGERIIFEDFPGEILAEGQIAQGIAGRMGSGEQLIAVMSKDIVFRTGYSGRLYGAARAHYYKFDGEKIIAATWEQREDSDIF